MPEKVGVKLVPIVGDALELPGGRRTVIVERDEDGSITVADDRGSERIGPSQLESFEHRENLWAYRDAHEARAEADRQAEAARAARVKAELEAVSSGSAEPTLERPEPKSSRRKR